MANATRVLQPAPTRELTEGAKQQKLLQGYQNQQALARLKQYVQSQKQDAQRAKQATAGAEAHKKAIGLAQTKQVRQTQQAQKVGAQRQQREERQAQAIGSKLFKGRPKWFKPIQARLKILPDLGSPFLPLSILLGLLFFIVPYGPQNKTRAQLLYDVVIGNAGIAAIGPTQTGPGGGGGGGNPPFDPGNPIIGGFSGEG